MTIRSSKPGPKAMRADVIAAAEKYAGAGISDKLTDRSYWLDNDPRNQDWYEALHAFDARDERGALLALLRSGAELTPKVRKFLADLIERQPKRRRYRTKKDPEYDVSESNITLVLAVKDVRKLVDQGTSVENALDEIAANRRLKFTTLHQAYNGRHGGFREVLKQFPALDE